MALKGAVESREAARRRARGHDLRALEALHSRGWLRAVAIRHPGRLADCLRGSQVAMAVREEALRKVVGQLEDTCGDGLAHDPKPWSSRVPAVGTRKLLKPLLAGGGKGTAGAISDAGTRVTNGLAKKNGNGTDFLPSLAWK